MRLQFLILITALSAGCGSSTATRSWTTSTSGAKTSTQPAKKAAPTEPESRLPDDAKPVGEVRKASSPPETVLVYRCLRDGRVFIFDRTTQTVLMAWPLKQGQEFSFNLRISEAAVDGKQVMQLPLLDDQEVCQLFFAPR